MNTGKGMNVHKTSRHGVSILAEVQNIQKFSEWNITVLFLQFFSVLALKNSIIVHGAFIEMMP
jgi:hypothetical protein